MCVGTSKHVHGGELVLGVRDRHGSLGIIVFIYLPQVTARPGFSFNASLLDRFFIVESAQSVDLRQREQEDSKRAQSGCVVGVSSRATVDVQTAGHKLTL